MTNKLNTLFFNKGPPKFASPLPLIDLSNNFTNFTYKLSPISDPDRLDSFKLTVDLGKTFFFTTYNSLNRTFEFAPQFIETPLLNRS